MRLSGEDKFIQTTSVEKGHKMLMLFLSNGTCTETVTTCMRFHLVRCFFSFKSMISVYDLTT